MEVQTKVSFVSSVAMAPDGRTVFTGDLDGNIYKWDLDAAKSVGRFRQQSDGNWGLSVSPDGKTIGLIEGTAWGGYFRRIHQRF